jgi:hypothetical protein
LIPGVFMLLSIFASRFMNWEFIRRLLTLELRMMLSK